MALEREFAERNLAAALGQSWSRRATRRSASSFYLERIVQPSLPDIAIEPRRLRSMLTVLSAEPGAMGHFSLLLASVREHVD